MNLGLGNLIEVKRQLLPVSLQAGTSYDAVITKLGQGVAGQFEKHCNRLFARLAGAVDEFPADRDFWITLRYPLETITSVEQRDTVSGGWEVLGVNDVIQQRVDRAGVLQFGAAQGTRLSSLRLTYTGGLWFDTAESEDTAQPAGSTALPDDLRQAWYLQCQHIWASRDKLGAGIAGKPNEGADLGGLKLIPQVEAMLAGHIRYNLVA